MALEFSFHTRPRKHGFRIQLPHLYPGSQALRFTVFQFSTLALLPLPFRELPLDGILLTDSDNDFRLINAH